MALAEAFDAVVEEVNALMPELQLETIKHYVTIDDSIVLQDLCEFYYKQYLKYSMIDNFL